MTTENYVYKKEVDWSLLQEGLTLPFDNQVVFGQIMGRFLKRGESKDITLYLNGKSFKAKITNVNFDPKFKRKKDILQIRYSKNGELAKALQACFSKSYQFIKTTREMREPGDRTMIRLPEECKEYIAIYTTEYDDSYILETIVADDIISLRQAVSGQKERVMEAEFNYDVEDSSSTILETERIVKIRKLNKKIGDKSTAVSVKNEVMEMIVKVRERKGGLDLPIVSGKHLRKISDRTALQSADNAEKFITARKIDSFESLEKFTADKEQRYQQLETVHLSKGQKLNRLKELSKMYALYAPIQATYKESQLLKGLAKMRYDKEHKDSLSKYRELKERMQSLLQNGEKITPKQWKAEIQSLQSEYDSIGKEQTKTATELAYAEVISYNRKNIERELQNESRQRNRQQGKIKRREEEI